MLEMEEWKEVGRRCVVEAGKECWEKVVVGEEQGRNGLVRLALVRLGVGLHLGGPGSLTDGYVTLGCGRWSALCRGGPIRKMGSPIRTRTGETWLISAR